MRGIVYDGESADLVDGIELAEPGSRQVVVEMAAAGLCQSDVAFMTGKYPVPSPAVCGHEGAGIVNRVGDAVTSVKPGDHVVITTLASCGACVECGAGRPTHCRSTIGAYPQPFSYKGEALHMFAGASAFAERTLVQEVQCVKIPDDVPLTSAALVGCGVVTGVGAVMNRAKVQHGESAVVFGVGGVGLNVIQGLRIVGANPIIAVDINPGKEELARQFGATHFINSTEEDVVARVGELSPASPQASRGVLGSGGVKWAFDCVAVAEVTETALATLDWGGTVVIVGVGGFTDTFASPYLALTHVERNIIGCRYGSISPHRDIPLLMDLYQRGQLMLDELVTGSYSMEEWSEAVDELKSGALARGVITF